MSDLSDRAARAHGKPKGYGEARSSQLFVQLKHLKKTEIPGRKFLPPRFTQAQRGQHIVRVSNERNTSPHAQWKKAWNRAQCLALRAFAAAGSTEQEVSAKGTGTNVPRGLGRGAGAQVRSEDSGIHKGR